MTKTTIGAGNVTFMLAGAEVTLRPSLRCAQAISKQSGGIMAAIQAISRFDLEVMTSIIALGLDAKGPQEMSKVATQVYETGMSNLIEPVTTFLTILANGGRPVDSDGGEGTVDPQ